MQSLIQYATRKNVRYELDADLRRRTLPFSAQDGGEAIDEIFWALQVSPSQPPKHPLLERIMEYQEMPEQGFLHLADDAFWGDPAAAAGMVFSRAFLNQKTLFALDGPRGPVDVTLRETLPLLALSAVMHAENARWSFRKQTVLAATSLRTFKTYLAPAVEPRGDVVPVTRDPNAPVPEGMAGEEMKIDARQRLGLPWVGDKLLFTLLSARKVSNRVQMELTGVPRPGFVPPVIPAEGHWQAPQETPKVGEPPMPDAPGLTLRSPTSVAIEHQGPLPVRGALRVEVPSTWLLQTSPQTRDGPVAVMPVQLAMLSSIAPFPKLRSLEVPVFAPPGAAAGSTLGIARFAVDLDELGAFNLFPQTVYVYGFCGPWLAEPLEVTVQ